MSTPAKIRSVVLWSVISAAFIGPGTITTAVSAGVSFQLGLLWAVVFATLACIVLQEASARIIISSGLTFGECIQHHFGAGWVKWLVAVPVLLGCAAYEAGNILGAASGLSLLTSGNTKWLTTMVTVAAAVILWRGGNKLISNTMMFLVVIMAIAFAMLAFKAKFTLIALVKASVIPQLPAGSEWIALALVGTTIVPYNIFIGSAISKGNTIPLMRIGLTVSVMIGGIITACILLAGTVAGAFTSFPALAEVLENNIGSWAALALGVGLFAAGFSSAITSPYAASLIASTVLGSENKKHVRLVWAVVLLTGFGFGISGVKPIPVILAVQALNGFVLPLLAYFLTRMANDNRLVKAEHQHAAWYNSILLLIFGITALIGINNVDKAVSDAFKLTAHFEVVVTITAVLLALVTVQLVRSKKRPG
ncbi:MAG: Nramp family divalent metal transporter [Cyclobacteriaceae bacterium]|nr:Nramp family divalent metal transporter [Cyclobacteriaceae bacterium]